MHALGSRTREEGGVQGILGALLHLQLQRISNMHDVHGRNGSAVH
jgi:hypothetical protein